MKAFLFPGQGSQRKGMGRDLFPRYPDLVRAADSILGYSIAELCADDPRQELNQTAFTQPAVFVVSILACLEARRRLPPPGCMAGHSVGEYAALTMAEVFDFETGLRIVAHRARLMSGADGGGLAAVLGLSLAGVEALLVDAPGIEIANINTPAQVVVGGPSGALGRFLSLCRDNGVRAVPLRVSGAFHTSQMKQASQKFRGFLQTIEFRAPVIPVACNLTGDFYEGAAGMADILARHIASPVLWMPCIERMIGAGVTGFEEIGGARILAPMADEIQKHFSSLPDAETRNLRPAPSHKPGNGTNSRSIESFTLGPLVAGSLGQGLSGAALVAALAAAGTWAFLDTEGVQLEEVEHAVRTLSASPAAAGRFGLALAEEFDPEREEELVDLCLNHRIRTAELSGYAKPSAAVERYRADPANRILVHVTSRRQMETYLPANGPCADYVCACTRPSTGDGEPDLTLFHEALARRSMARAANGNPVLVGAVAPEGSRRSVEAILQMGADFVTVRSAFLLASETGLAAALRQTVKNGKVRPRLLPDWRLPELETRTWTLPGGEDTAAALEALQSFYSLPRVKAEDLAAFCRDRAEVAGFIGPAALSACEGLSGPALRNKLRMLVRDAMRGRAVLYDGPLCVPPAPSPDSSALPSAAAIAGSLQPQTAVLKF